MKLDEEYYYACVLGFDLLYDEFKESSNSCHNLMYNFCTSISKDFLKSEYYQDDSCSGYDKFCKYVNDNKFEILKKYEKATGIEEKYFKDNKKILEKATRKGEPVALVEWKRGNDTEYVIAVDLFINDKELSWARGFYYSNLNDAIFDFEQVKQGKYLKNNLRAENILDSLKRNNPVSNTIALEYLFENGRKNLFDDKYYQMLQDKIKNNDDKGSLVTNEFALHSLEVAKEMASLGTTDLCNYIYSTERQKRNQERGR